MVLRIPGVFQGKTRHKASALLVVVEAPEASCKQVWILRIPCNCCHLTSASGWFTTMSHVWKMMQEAMPDLCIV